MTLTDLQTKVAYGEIDANSYRVTINDHYSDLSFAFEVKANMPYQYWLDMYQFWYGHFSSSCNIIKDVLAMLGRTLGNHVLSTFDNSEVSANLLLDNTEGFANSEQLNITRLDFDLDFYWQLGELEISSN